jgi:redox-sensitive bicupin YhaK (pirin superfamily)
MRILIMLILSLLPLSPAMAAAPVIDNDEVAVWDVTLTPGGAGVATPRASDSVTIFLKGGTIRTTAADKSSSSATRDFGDAVFHPKGSDAVDAVMGDGLPHEIIIALKQTPTYGPPNMEFLNAFPREGARKAFENDRIVVWNYSWKPGVPVPMHHHDKDVVMAFRYDGPVRSTESTGQSSILDFRKGMITFSKAGRIHSETLVGERQSGIMVELK